MPTAGSKPSTAREQSQVALLDQVLQAEPLAGVTAGDIDHQAEVGADHAVAGLVVAAADGDGQFVFIFGRKQRGLVDLAEIGLQRGLHRGGLAASCFGHGHKHTGSAGGVARHNYRPWRGLSAQSAPMTNWGDCSQVPDGSEKIDLAGRNPQRPSPRATTVITGPVSRPTARRRFFDEKVQRAAGSAIRRASVHKGCVRR